MTLSQFASKLNWRLMLIHLIACWFFIYSFLELSALHDIAFVHALSQHFENAKGLKVDRTINAIKVFGYERIRTNLLWLNLSNLVGLLIAFTISLILSLKYKWYWLNSVIILLVAFFLNRFNLFGWHFLKHIFLKPGLLFKSDTAFYLTNGLIMLIIGLLLFFLKWSVRFINGNRLSQTVPKATGLENEQDPALRIEMYTGHFEGLSAGLAANASCSMNGKPDPLLSAGNALFLSSSHR